MERSQNVSKEPVVLTLDAGGTTFVFNAIQAGRLLLPEGVVLPSAGDCLETSVRNVIEGFRQVREAACRHGTPVAVSFAFPGPADYERGIIGDLDNLPAYRGAVPLGPLLERELGLPVFIRNDGDLFAYGVALHGELAQLNRELAAAGAERRLTSCLGMTLGTGWGCGFVKEGQMFVGSSSTGLEIGASPWCGGGAIEETVSRSGLVRLYCEEARKVGVRNLPDPADPAAPPIVAAHARAAEGPQGEAARQALKRFGEACGFGIAWAVNLLDPDLVVVGGGVAGAWDLFFPHLWAYLRSRTPSGRPRIFKRLFDLSDPGQREEYLQDESAVMAKKKTGILRSSLSTDRAVMLGAYEVALRSGRLKL